jgi:hypothetical protein
MEEVSMMKEVTPMEEGLAGRDITVEDKTDLKEKTTEAIKTIPLEEEIPNQKSRKRARPFAIYIDPDCEKLASKKVSTPKTQTPDGDNRIPLSDLHISPSSSTSSSPRDPSMPFTFNSTDPCWEDKENYLSYTTTLPAPAPPHSQGLRDTQVPRISQEQPRLRAQPRTLAKLHGYRRRINMSNNIIPFTASTSRGSKTLHQLGYEDGAASTKDVKTAIRKSAIKVHVDNVAGERDVDGEATK